MAFVLIGRQSIQISQESEHFLPAALFASVFLSTWQARIMSLMPEKVGDMLSVHIARINVDKGCALGTMTGVKPPNKSVAADLCQTRSDTMAIWTYRVMKENQRTP